MTLYNGQVAATYDLDSVRSNVVVLPSGPYLADTGTDVKRINQYEFYEMGYELRALTSLPDEATAGQAYTAFANASRWFSRLLSGDWIELSFSRHEAQEILGEIRALMKSYYYDDNGELDFKKWELKLPPWTFSIIKSSLTTFEYNFRAELREASTYYVSRKSIYDTARLVEFAESRIPDDLRKFVNPVAQRDFHDAGRCLAFNLPTASGLHSARAVEGVLGDYYQAFAGSGKKVQGSGTMNDYLAELEDQNTVWPTGKNPEKKTLRCLREIKDLDRNRLMHPRETLDETEAEIFFNIATSAIMCMTREMAAVAAVGQGTLALAVVSAPLAPPHQS